MGIEYKIKKFDNVKNSLVGKILAYGLAGSLALGSVYSLSGCRVNEDDEKESILNIIEARQKIYLNKAGKLAEEKVHGMTCIIEMTKLDVKDITIDSGLFKTTTAKAIIEYDTASTCAILQVDGSMFSAFKTGKGRNVYKLEKNDNTWGLVTENMQIIQSSPEKTTVTYP